MKPVSAFIRCGNCTRGGNGTDPNPCSCGWQVTDTKTILGCFLGTPIPEGSLRKVHPKRTRSQERYRRWLHSDDGRSFGEYLRGGAA